MAKYLRQYDSVTGQTNVVHPVNDPVRAKSIIFKNIVELDETNIALKSEVNAVQMVLNSFISAFNAHENSNLVSFSNVASEIESLYGLVFLANQHINKLTTDYPLMEKIVLTAGQTIVQFSTLNFAPDNAVRDVNVSRNGLSLFGDPLGGVAHDFRKLDNHRIELTRPAEEGDRIVGVMNRSLLNTTPSSYFYEYVTGVSSRGVPTPQRYAVGADRLSVFLNGILMNKTAIVGSDVSQYEETNQFQITLGNPTSTFEVNPESSDVFSFLHKDAPVYRVLQDGLTGTLLTVPTYVMASSRLLVWRNGVLMNSQGLGDAVDQYVETSTTSITLAEAATSDEVFVFEYVQAIQWRQDIDNVVGAVVNFLNPYTIGTDKLLVFRNGRLMYRSLSLGEADERYTHTTTTSVSLSEDATADEVFSVVYL